VANKVGLILFTGTMKGLTAILQRRGEIDFDGFNEPHGPYGWKEESWAGALQVTCHGKCKEHETEREALLRECEEELGSTIASEITDRFDELKQLSTNDDPSLTLGHFINADYHLPRMRLHSSSGGLKLICAEDLDQIKPLKGFDKKQPVPNGIMAMHDDEIRALRKGFESF
jgi:hypothetical protein